MGGQQDSFGPVPKVPFTTIVGRMGAAGSRPSKPRNPHASVQQRRSPLHRFRCTLDYICSRCRGFQAEITEYSIERIFLVYSLVWRIILSRYCASLSTRTTALCCDGHCSIVAGNGVYVSRHQWQLSILLGGLPLQDQITVYTIWFLEISCSRLRCLLSCSSLQL